MSQSADDDNVAGLIKRVYSVNGQVFKRIDEAMAYAREADTKKMLRHELACLMNNSTPFGTPTMEDFAAAADEIMERFTLIRKTGSV
jgi:hypothetical protein